MRSHLWLLLLGSSLGCGGVSAQARATAGRIGCPATEIDILDRQGEESGPRSWTARCHGRTYVCSSGRDLAATRDVVCAELAR